MRPAVSLPQTPASGIPVKRHACRQREASPNQHRPLGALLVGGLLSGLLLTSVPAVAGQIRCAITYGGETTVVDVSPTRDPYTVPTRAVGSFLLFRAVFRDTPADLAGIDLYTYADRDAGPLIVHHASYPWPLPDGDFTGLQRVYEPLHDSELQYRCRHEDAKS